MFNTNSVNSVSLNTSLNQPVKTSPTGIEVICYLLSCAQECEKRKLTMSVLART